MPLETPVGLAPAITAAGAVDDRIYVIADGQLVLLSAPVHWRNLSSEELSLQLQPPITIEAVCQNTNGNEQPEDTSQMTQSLPESNTSGEAAVGSTKNLDVEDSTNTRLVVVKQPQQPAVSHDW